jgi:hypothetical protein
MSVNPNQLLAVICTTQIFSDMWAWLVVLVWAWLLPVGPEYFAYRLLYKNANFKIRTTLFK